MAAKLIALRAPNTSYWAWGYSFPWQTRTIVVPRGEPNLVCTSFVANALLDLYEEKGDCQFLNMAVNAAEYLLDELFWTEGGSLACFAYPLPSSRTKVHNANFLGAALLCRTHKHTGEKKYLEVALKVTRYSASKQNQDGSWEYGEHATQGWIDNFHTGYNLCALRSISQDTGTEEFESQIRRGFNFFRANFFRHDGAPKYFHARTYPIDIHCVAQSIITLLAFRDYDSSNVDLACDVFRWALIYLLNNKGYFYYQKKFFYTTKISYMRWSQAWMLYSLTKLAENVQ